MSNSSYMSHREKRALHNQSSEEEEIEEDQEGMNFFDDAAIEDNEEESEDHVMGQAELEDYQITKKLYTTENVAGTSFVKKLADPRSFIQAIEQKDKEEELIAEIHRTNDYAFSLPERDPQRNYPIYAIKCRMGLEREIAMRIMKLWISKKDRPMHMFSVYAPQEKKGIVYIEAMDEKKFVDACDGVRDIYVNTIKALTEKQIEELLVNRMPNQIEPDSFVRVNSGMYKDDLGIVTQTLENKRVIVKLVPRFDIGQYQLIAKEMRKSRNDEDNEQRKRTYPKPTNVTKQIFDPIDLGIGDVVKAEEDEDGTSVYHFNKATYYDGFVFKTYKIDQLKFNDIVPTQEETVQFSQGDEMHAKGKLRFGKTRTFKEGDLVEIVNPDERVHNKKTKIVHVDGDKVVVMGNELKDPITLTTDDVSIYFNIGDRVRVTDGMYSNETGIIEAVRNDEVFILTDKKKATITVGMIDVENTQQITQQITELNGYFVNDFVQLADGVGLVLEILADKNRLLILTDSNKSQEIDPSLIQGKFQERRDARCKDRNKNFVSLGDIVNIIGGTYRGREAKVLHIYQYAKLFVQCPGIIENNSFIVVSNRDVVGPNANHQAFIPKGERRNDRRDDRSGFNEPTRNDRLSFREYKGKKVQVREGAYKGYKGKIVNCKGKDFMIELDANQRIITLDEDGFKLFDTVDTTRSYASQMQTPRVEGSVTVNTPAPATPASHSLMAQSSHFPSASTPRYGQTPMPNYLINTPMPNPATPMTPSMSRIPPKTPAASIFRNEPPPTPH